MNPHSYLIVGGSSGLGEACVRRLAAAGRSGVIADIHAPPQSLLDDCGGRFVFSAADVRDEAAIRAALSEAQNRFGPVRGAVVSAGVLHSERILGRQGICDLDAFRRVVEVNLVGTFNVLRLTANVMQGNEPDADGERGTIITTSSTAAFDGQIGQSAYAASKGAIAAITLPAARELGRFGIRVVSIAPGVFETPMMQAASPEQRQALESQVPFPPRFGRADEFAALVEHIFANRMLNGTVIRLDGGLRMAAR